MLSPFIPDYSGTIDPRKVRFALLRYRLIFFWVMAVNMLINAAFIFFVLHSIYASLFVIAVYFCVSILFLIVIKVLKQKVPTEKFPECAELDTPIYNEMVTLWAACCKRSGYASGYVYVVYPLPGTKFEEFHNSVVSHTLFSSRAPVLFMAGNMFSKFSRKELHALMFHESGHLETAPDIIWLLTDLIALPMSMMLRVIAQLRGMLPVRWTVPIRIIYGLERGLHFLTMFAANHADEYSADAYAAEKQNTAEHMIAVLEGLDNYHQVRCVADIMIAESSLALDKESHWHIHPTTRERIRRLERLRKDR